MADSLTEHPMRILFASALLAFTPAAHPDSIARVGADWVRVTALPCKDEAVSALIVEAGEDPADYRAASAEFGGQPFAACWKPLMERGVIYLRYTDGDAGLVPFGELKPVREI